MRTFLSSMFFLFSVHGLAQLDYSVSNATEKELLQTNSENLETENRVISYYHVEEKINSRFGGCITTYNVTDLKNVNTKELGPNNTRTVTPKYKKISSKYYAIAQRNNQLRISSSNQIKADSVALNEKEKIEITKKLPFQNSGMNQMKLKSTFLMNSKKQSISKDSLKWKNTKTAVFQEMKDIKKDIITQNSSEITLQENTKSKLSNKLSLKTEVLEIKKVEEKPIATEEKNSSDTTKKYITVDVIGAYERILDKGYVSKDLLMKVGNSYFFKGNLEMAAKRYSQLFNIAKDLESIYYFRFSNSLSAIGETKKADAMYKVFEKMSLTKK